MASYLAKVLLLACPALAMQAHAAETGDASASESTTNVTFLPSAPAQGPEKLNVAIDARVDFSWEKPKDDDHTSGFHGKYFNLMVKGEIIDGLSYSWRQRLNKFQNISNDVFSATDWIYISYKFTPNWSASAGKQVVAIGGYEYDAAPINVYYASLFWNNIACYQFGVSGSYTTSDGNHTLTAQVCNSPYRLPGESCYAYNLMWNGSMGIFSTIWSVNLLEYDKGHYADYIALGNRFDFGVANIELDLMNRHSSHGKFLLGDYSVIAKAEYIPCEQLTIFAKGGYEKYRPVPGHKYAIEKPFYGAGVEVRPIKHYHNLRLHALWDMNHGDSGLRYQEIQVGLTWKVDLLSIR